MDAKVCTICKTEKPLSEFRPGGKRPNGKRYPASDCNECHRLEASAYRNRNIEVVRARELAYTRANAERNRENARAWYYGNKERAAVQRREAYLRDPQLVRDRAHMSRARKEGAPTIELVRRQEVFERDGGICHVCALPVPFDVFEMDHLVPLSEGGDHTYANVAVSHKPCNLGRRTWSDHCPHGHLFDEANTRIRKSDGSRQCRACAREKARKKRAEAKAAVS